MTYDANEAEVKTRILAGTRGYNALGKEQDNLLQS